jgi:hypothetical protein
MKNIFPSMFVRSVVLFLISLIPFSAAHAAIVEGLYEAEVIVQSQSHSQRDQAMGDALLQVCKKVSGRSNVQNLPGISDALSHPDRFLQQYLYRGITEAQYPIPNADPNSQLAWFRFDEQAVNHLLRNNNLPVWGRTRPSTLVWLAIEENGQRYILGADSQEQLRDLLLYDAKRQGMALVLPLLDLQDQQALSFADLWGNFQDSILNASTRYQAEAVLVGRLSLTSRDRWSGRWTLYENGRNFSWEGQDSDPDVILNSGMGTTMEALANRYAQLPNDSSPSVVYLAVKGVHSLKDYARVNKYLSSLELVKDIHPTTVQGDSARFRLDIRGNAEGLAQTIKLGNVLQEQQVTIESPAVAPSSAASFFGMPASNTSDPTLSQNQNSDYTYRLLP